jgi:hypothetical protein
VIQERWADDLGVLRRRSRRAVLIGTSAAGNVTSGVPCHTVEAPLQHSEFGELGVDALKAVLGPPMLGVPVPAFGQLRPKALQGLSALSQFGLGSLDVAGEPCDVFFE